MNNSTQAILQQILQKPIELVALPIEPTSHFSPYWIVLALLSVILIWRLVSRKKVSREFVYIVGERNSGKTKLFYKLTKGKEFETIPSYKNNLTRSLINTELKTFVDVTGDNHSKEEFLHNIVRAFRILLVVDGSAPNTFAATAELLYRISVSKAFQQNEPDFVIVLNKSDRVDYVGAKMFKKQLEDEIERIKLSRKALIEEKESEEDLLREQKSRYTLPFNVIEVSLLGKIDTIETFISEGTQL